MRILLAVNDTRLSGMLSGLLKADGHEVLIAPAVTDLLCLVNDIDLHLVVYELSLPDLAEGLEQCRRLRAQSGVFLVLISDPVPLEDKLGAFGAGADDYLVRPFDVRELHTRVLAHLRRHPQQRVRPGNGILHITPNATLDLHQQALTIQGQPVYLRPLEFKLLTYLVHNPRVVLSRGRLLEAVWGYSCCNRTREVDVYIHYLRQKIEPTPNEPRYIRTVWSVGYMFTPDGET